MDGIYDITAKQGCIYNKVFTYSTYGGSLIDLTGWTAKMEVRVSVGGALFLTASTDNAKIVLGGILGTVTLRIASSDTAAMPVRCYVYDIILTDSAGGRRPFLQGTFTIEGTVTEQ